MHRHYRYIQKQLLGPFLVVLLGLTGVVWLTQSLRFIDLIVNKGLSIGLFLSFTAMLMPSVIGIILPIALFIATAHTYHRLIADSEIVALRAAGLSNLGLAAPAVGAGVLAMVVVYAINLYFMPAGFRMFKDMQFEIRNSYASVLLQEGVFNTPVEGLTIYVRAREPGGELSGILVHDSRDPAQPSTVMAERGMLVRTNDGARFVLLNGNRQQIDVRDGQLAMLYFDSYAFDFGADSAFSPIRFREAKERYLDELLWPTDVEEDRHRREFAAEAHRRLVSPLFAVVLTLIAAAALLPGEFNRRGQAGRIVAAVAGAVSFLAVTYGLNSALVRSPWAVPIYYAAVAGVGIGCLYLLSADRPGRLLPAAVRRSAV